MSTTEAMSRAGARVALVIPLFLSACSNLPISRTEQAYQALSAVDFAQTINTARRPDCFVEQGFASVFIGRSPSVASVGLFWAAQAVTHAVITRWLENQAENVPGRGWDGALHMWQTLTIGLTTYDVAHNASIGLRPFGDGINRYCTEHGVKP
jgi:hypothetical protein